MQEQEILMFEVLITAETPLNSLILTDIALHNEGLINQTIQGLYNRFELGVKSAPTISEKVNASLEYEDESDEPFAFILHKNGKQAMYVKQTMLANIIFK